MTNEFKERAKFWDSSHQNYDEEKILEFEKEWEIKLPESYRQLLKEYGKLKFIKTWFFYYQINNDCDHLIGSSLSIENQNVLWENIWKEIESNNPNLQNKNYLPIWETHSPNFLFLIGITDESKGKIYEYDMDYENFKPIEVAKNLEDFFLNKIYSQFRVDSNIGTLNIFKNSGEEIWGIEKVIFKSENNQLNILVESKNNLIRKTENTNENLDVKFNCQIELNEFPNLNNPDEIIISKKNTNIKSHTSKFNYFESEIPQNLKIGMVKGYKEILYIRVEGQIKNTYEWEKDYTNFRISFKIKKEAST